MRRIPFLAMLTLFLAACQDATVPTGTPDVAATLAPVASLQQARDRVMPGEVLMAVRSGADPAEVAAAHGASLARPGHSDRFFVLRGAAGNERALAARLGTDPRVVFAEPNWLRQPTVIDPRLWGFYNPGGLTIAYTQGRNRGKVVGSKVSLDDADIDNVEGYASGGAPVVIGSIDTGVQFGHPEFLPGQLIAGHDWYSNDTDPSDGNGHGTHTTGTMAGQNVGVAGVSGAGSSVRVYVQRVCGSLGCPTSAIVNAIYAAADYPGMVAMNLSLGGGSESQAERNAIAYAVNTKNVLVIASAGNDGTNTVSCPACDPLAISVAALNWQDKLSYYSNRGSGLDMSAPGGEMYSNTTEEGGIYSSVPGGYAYYQGTSMSAPMVTGTAGIVASVTGLRGAQLRNRLESTADDLGSGGYDPQFGHGRVNAYRAVTGTTLDESGGGGGGGGSALAASFTHSCSGTTCAFDASGSSGATAYSWDFGDGSGDSGVTTSHTYAAQDATWTVTLTVNDGQGGSDSTSDTVVCRVRGKKIRCN